MTLLTIGVPTFNRAGDITALLECLDPELASVAPGDVRVLVSDNDSEDDTAAVLASWADSRPWLQIHRQPENIGAVANARWLATEAAAVSGCDYLWLFGDDDVVTPGALAQLVAILRAERPAWLFLPHHWIDVHGNHVPGSPAPGVVERHASAADLYRAYHHWLTFISASIVDAAALRDAAASIETENRYAPLLWFFRAALDGPCVVAPDHVVRGSQAISWEHLQHVILTEHFTSLYDDGLHEGITREQFGLTLDGLYGNTGQYKHWRGVPIDRFARIVARFPESQALRAFLFQSAREQAHRESLPVLDEAARAVGADSPARALVAQGEQVFAAGDPAGAANLFVAAANLMPSLATAWSDLAVALHALGRLPEASRAIEAALFAAPDDADVLENRDLLADELARSAA